MALFELADAHLTPAQFGHVADAATVDLALDAIRAHIIDVLGFPVFPIQWQPLAQGHALAALDPAGKVVIVLVTAHMDAATLVAGLAHASAMGAGGMRAMASMYPGGVSAFRRDWSDFTDAVGMDEGCHDRLIALTTSLPDDVRSSLSMMGASGVHVRRIQVRTLTSGRTFVQIDRLATTRMHDFTQQLLIERSPHPVYENTEPVATPDSQVEHELHSAPTPVEPTPGTDSQMLMADSDVMDSAMSASSADLESEQVQMPVYDEPYGPLSDEAMRCVGAVLEADTPLVWQSLRRGIFHEAVMTQSGILRLSTGEEFTDPTQAAIAAQGNEDVDGWHVWRFGLHGPTLRRAWQEVRSIDSHQPARRAGRRARA